RIVDIAVSYPALENCMVSTSLGYSSQSPATLKNARVALPMGTTVHFGLLKQLNYIGVNPASLEFFDMSPSRAAAALSQGDADIACGWGPALDVMQANGQPLLRPEDKQAAGAYTFDSTLIRASFGADNPEVVARFLKVTNDLNTSFQASPQTMVARIAETVEMSEVTDTMSGFDFPDIEAKLGATWLGGDAQNHLKALADFLVEQSTLDAALDDYTGFIDPSYLQTAADLPLIDSE
ncbi:MAG: ABC transporter substrate-binding protein, partial [Alphaproteobacteria bacterium]